MKIALLIVLICLSSSMHGMRLMPRTQPGQINTPSPRATSRSTPMRHYALMSADKHRFIENELKLPRHPEEFNRILARFEKDIDDLEKIHTASKTMVINFKSHYENAEHFDRANARKNWERALQNYQLIDSLIDQEKKKPQARILDAETLAKYKSISIIKQKAPAQRSSMSSTSTQVTGRSNSSSSSLNIYTNDSNIDAFAAGFMGSIIGHKLGSTMHHNSGSDSSNNGL